MSPPYIVRKLLYPHHFLFISVITSNHWKEEKKRRREDKTQITRSRGHTPTLHEILSLITGLLTISWSQKNCMMSMMWAFNPFQLLVTGLLPLRRPTTFLLKASLERRGTSSFQHDTSRCNRVKGGWGLSWPTSLAPLYPTAYIQLLHHCLQGQWTLCKTSCHSGHIRHRILLLLNQSWNVLSKAVEFPY